MFRGHHILPRTPEEAGLSQPELAFRRALQLGQRPLIRDTADDVQRALDGLASDFGPEVALWASYTAVSAWWREQHGVWGHPDASCVHAELGDAIRGRPSPWLADKPPVEQEAIRQRAAAAYVDWEDAGRPGLTEYAAKAREYIVSLRGGRRNNSNNEGEAA